MLNKLKFTYAVIDSGIGGISVLNQLIDKNKGGNYIYFADNLHMPYGNMKANKLKKRIDEIINILQSKYEVDEIIIACNTASSVIDKQNYKNVHTLSFSTNKIYLTTDLTKRNLNNIHCIADKTLAKAIEQHVLDKKMPKILNSHIKKLHLNDYDEIILGCTHYELVIDQFQALCPNVKFVKNSEFLLDDIPIHRDDSKLTIQYLTSKNSKKYIEKLIKLGR